jgi:hypothetical protein
VADLLGVCRETVCHWWSAYVNGGFDALPHDRTGRPLGSGRACPSNRPHTSNNCCTATSPTNWASLPHCGPAALSAS